MCDYRETCSARELRKDDFICFGSALECKVLPLNKELENLREENNKYEKDLEDHGIFEENVSKYKEIVKKLKECQKIYLEEVREGIVEIDGLEKEIIKIIPEE